jgi:hypothetical protein
MLGVIGCGIMIGLVVDWNFPLVVKMNLWQKE